MRSSVVIFLALLVAACQPVPRPFQHDRAAAPNELLQLSDAGGIRVQAVEDAPRAPAERLADEMVAALIKRNVPAFRSGGNRTSLVLASQVVDPGQDAHIAWTLFGPDGGTVGSYNLVLEGTPIDSWANADPDLMAAMAQTAAEPISRLVQHERVAEVQAPPIYVGDIRGANEQQALRLRTSLRQALRGLGTRLSNVSSQDTLTASADVKITQLAGAMSEVAIVWRIHDPFGTEIGKIDQASPVPDKAVAEQWGTLARQAGVAAAAGISQLVSSIDWRDGFLPPPPEPPSRGLPR